MSLTVRCPAEADTRAVGRRLASLLRAGDVVLLTAAGEQVFTFRNPPHVHQPLIQTIVDELRGRGKCESTGESGARASWVLDQCLAQWRSRAN